MSFVMASGRLRRPTALLVLISVLLLHIFTQMAYSLLLRCGTFIKSTENVISPFRSCVTREDDGLSCDLSVRGADGMDILAVGVILCLYSPLVLVAFALLSMVFAVYTKDSATLLCSFACQALSSFLVLSGVALFLLLNKSYIKWEDMTLGFYICVGVHVQLVLVTAMTFFTRRRLPSDWELVP